MLELRSLAETLMSKGRLTSCSFAFRLQEKAISWPESGQSKYQENSLEICDLVQAGNARYFHFKDKETWG